MQSRLGCESETHMAQDAEPALASFLHTTILAHRTLAHSMAFMLANKLSSRTLLGTQLMRMIQDVYEADPVRPEPLCWLAPMLLLLAWACKSRPKVGVGRHQVADELAGLDLKAALASSFSSLGSTLCTRPMPEAEEALLCRASWRQGWQTFRQCTIGTPHATSTRSASCTSRVSSPSSATGWPTGCGTMADG